MPAFAFRMRAYAAAHFAFDDVLWVNWPDAVANFSSEYTGGDDGRAYPVTIHGEIRGDGSSPEEAEPRLAAEIGNVLPLISLAANAAVADPLAIAFHGLDLSEPQHFVGYMTPGPTDWFPPGKGQIDVEATKALIIAVGNHPQTGLLHRAIESYRRAVGHWFPEQHLLAGEFLSISAETLSRFLVESRAAARGMNSKNLARASGFGDEKALRGSYLRDEIFAGDQTALDGLYEASNGFEHGYMSVADIRGMIEPVLERSFGLVRSALIAATGLASGPAARLSVPAFDKPRTLAPPIFFTTGSLSRIDASIPAEPLGGAAVDIDWKMFAPVATRDAAGEVVVSFAREMTVRAIPPNTKLETNGYGMRVSNVSPVDKAPEVKLTRATDGAPVASSTDEPQQSPTAESTAVLITYQYEPSASGAIARGRLIAQTPERADEIVERLRRNGRLTQLDVQRAGGAP